MSIILRKHGLTNVCNLFVIWVATFLRTHTAVTINITKPAFILKQFLMAFYTALSWNCENLIAIYRVKIHGAVYHAEISGNVIVA